MKRSKARESERLYVSLRFPARTKRRKITATGRRIQRNSLLLSDEVKAQTRQRRSKTKRGKRRKI